MLSFPPRRLVTIYPKVDHFLPQEGKKKISRFSEFESNVSIILWILLIKCDVICINFVHFFLFIFAFIFWFYRMKRVDYVFLIDKVHTRLASWKNKLLNKAGRLILAKSVLNTIPTYYMQISWLPQSICNQLNKMTRKFIWKGTVSKGVHLVGWDKITYPKSFGGLGVWVARTTNPALLGKLVWDIHTNANKVWVQILSNKCLDNSSILDIPKKNGSTTWNSILKARSILKDGFVFWLGNDNTSFWYSSWTTLGTFRILIPWVDIHDISLCIRDGIINGEWNFNPLYTILPNNIQNHVKSIPPLFA